MVLDDVYVKNGSGDRFELCYCEGNVDCRRSPCFFFEGKCLAGHADLDLSLAFDVLDFSWHANVNILLLAHRLINTWKWTRKRVTELSADILVQLDLFYLLFSHQLLLYVDGTVHDLHCWIQRKSYYCCFSVSSLSNLVGLDDSWILDSNIRFSPIDIFFLKQSFSYSQHLINYTLFYVRIQLNLSKNFVLIDPELNTDTK